ncbi:3-hydroxyacyl-ACP dehydratase FabZ [Helicobacter cinaedi]|uniref:(3R)-hydroxymyristoyl-ACP dehydratase n=1 Tax=Helicobacter cinaedi CCUG 18818 = ATCC BAA-847 TaxID=537971 RepID=A0AAI8QG34_9HELI|nr:3-hydroxyacyl-ACP dehydratase FabZ [Helicobacter cinaedi]EFR46235.1 (3R)-hydroxymyristoyl-ACP dehydratase [Helicobacter cinaedi CCUG 18818 = ATCC BAA-847]QOQ90535.1 3-hydroxyacyl-ACP dehydratase FabZ [Helicobacter cinaedi]BAM31273.1 beta-hydroxyacyl-(acyl-carrier-protein) dehydratase [Helicobacter cinaedi CCUG 18818 = ATCC BAA-847]BBB18836.1 3-hydroxyacyl-[acyl-carrier-protein] dehydratase, FabZ form [Helicobacter cinaedi]
MTPLLQQLTINHIQTLTALTYPYLYVDRITELKPGEYVKGYKNVTFNEWFFPTHFKDDPIMPGMLQIEALTQLFTYVFLTLPGNEKKPINILEVDGVKLRQRVVPGQKLEMEVETLSWKRGIGIGKGKGMVDNKVVCEGQIKICMPDMLKNIVPKEQK